MEESAAGAEDETKAMGQDAPRAGADEESDEEEAQPAHPRRQ